jgi:hypothetical protein
MFVPYLRQYFTFLLTYDQKETLITYSTFKENVTDFSEDTSVQQSF